MSEGFDWSTGWLTGPQVRAAGGVLAGRYAVPDLSPAGRGISAAEYATHKAAKVSVFLYYEGTASWMLGGWDAGVEAAHIAEASKANAAMPERQPIHYAHDIDPDPNHFPAIEACLDGIASVVGWDKIGVYAGWLLIDHLARLGKIRYFVQTIAWEYGRGVHPAATAYQYDTRDVASNYVGGVACDRVRSLVDNFGQDTMFMTEPFPKADLPPWWDEQVAATDPHDDSYNGLHYMVARRNVSAIANTYRYTKPDIKSPKAGPPIKTRDKIAIERVLDVVTTDAKGKKKTNQWFLTRDGAYVFGGRFSPRVQIRHR